MLWPLSADHLCVSFSDRSDIHAAVGVEAFRASRDGKPIRTVCGIDVRGPYAAEAVNLAGERIDNMVLQWPPPAERRCPACDVAAPARKWGKRGHSSWRELRPVRPIR